MAAKQFYNANGLFLAQVGIGTNPQPFYLLLDTGSSIIWAGIVGSSDIYPLTHNYDPRLSTTSKCTYTQFNKRYGSGNCAGIYYIDRFTYLGYNQFSCIFGAAQTTNFNINLGDGIIWLSRKYQQPSLSFIHSIKNAYISISLAFSVKFNIINNQIVGKMAIGIDSYFYQQNVVTCPLITLSANPIFWACTLSYIWFKSAKASQTFNGGYVIFDTGTNNIMLPMQSFEEVKNRVKKFNCDVQESSGNYRLLCQLNDYIPDFVLSINGHEFTMPRNLFYKLYPNNILVPSLIFTNSIAAPIIGSPFFIVFHALFNHDSDFLAFAPSCGTIN